MSVFCSKCGLPGNTTARDHLTCLSQVAQTPEHRDGSAYLCPFCSRKAAYVEVTHGTDDGRAVTWTRPVFMCLCWSRS